MCDGMNFVSTPFSFWMSSLMMHVISSYIGRDITIIIIFCEPEKLVAILFLSMWLSFTAGERRLFNNMAYR